MQKAGYLREAVNTVFQGSAADLIKLSMIEIYKQYKNSDDIKILLQIHDELIFEVPNIELKKVSAIIKEEMTSVVSSDLHSFSIPLTVDINSGNNWGILH